MDLGIAGRVALIGGGSSGLGLAIAQELAIEGAHVSIAGRSRDKLETAKAAIEHTGSGEVLTFQLDVRDHDAVRAWANDTADHFGGLHIVVANAGGPPAGDALAFAVDGYRAAVELNLLSSIATVEAALPHLQSARWGRVLFVTSQAVKQPVPELALSNTARAGVLGYAKSLMHALGAGDITVNVLAPGPFRTERLLELSGHDEDVLRARGEAIALKRIGEPREFAAAAAFLASERASFITGLVMQVDGGATLSLS